MSANSRMGFYFSDWLGDVAVRRLTPAERGLWIDLLALMHAAIPAGYLVDNKGTPFTHEELARITNAAGPIEVAKLIDGILEKGAASSDRAGRLYNRRMVREAHIGAKRRANGQLGGSATRLKWQEISSLPQQNAWQMPRQKKRAPYLKEREKSLLPLGTARVSEADLRGSERSGRNRSSQRLDERKRAMSRPRKFAVRRQPNGQPHREPSHAPTEIRRLRDAALRGLRDAEWGTELGRMYLEGTVTDAQYRAGRKWWQDAAKYQTSIGTHPARSLSLERVSYGTNHNESPSQIAREETARLQFQAALDVLKSAGHAVLSTVRFLCENDEPVVGLAGLHCARIGLSRLALHYRFDKSAKTQDKHRGSSRPGK